MSLKDLSQEDFSFFKRYNDEMISVHEKEFLQVNDPDLMRAFYRGFKTKTNQFPEIDKSGKNAFFALNRIFTATNTLMPNIYWQNPRKIAVPTHPAYEQSAALMTSLQNYYMKILNQKRENQEAILNAWFFGLGWKKIGYHTAFIPREKTPETNLSELDKLSLQAQANGRKPDNLEAREVAQFVEYESLFNSSESPCNMLIDHKGTLMNHKVLTFRVKRTLHDLLTFGNYDKGAINRLREKFQFKNGTRFEDREIELNLNEMSIKQRNGIWILTYVDELDKPLRYDKADSNGRMPYVPLALTNEPGVRYPVAHMKVASGIQEWLDKQASLAVDVIGKLRNQHYVNEKILSPGQKDSFKRNLIGGVIFGNKPITSGDIVPLTSTPVRNDLFNMMSLTQQNLTELMGVDEQRMSGRSANDTLGQDKLAALGTQVRESGMLDKVRDWLIDQSIIEGEVLKQYSNANINLKITPEDYSNKETGQRIEETWVEFGTPNQPLGPKHFLQGEFDYTINIYEAVKPSKAVLRQELTQVLQVLGNPAISQQLLQQGQRVRLGDLVKELLRNYEYIQGQQFVEELDPQQQAAAQVSQMIQQRGGEVPASPQTQADQAMLQSQLKQEEIQAKPTGGGQ